MDNKNNFEKVIDGAKSKKLGHLFASLKDPSISKIGQSSISSLATESRSSDTYKTQLDAISNDMNSVFKATDASMAKYSKSGVITEQFSPVQKKLATMAYELAAKGVAGIDMVGSVDVSKDGIKTVATERFFHTNSVDARSLMPDSFKTLATEKFGSQELNNLITNTVTLAVAASGQSQFDALIFPIVPVDPLVNRHLTTVNYSTFGRPFNRFSGDVNQNQDNEEFELVLSLYKKERFKDDYIAVKPVVGKKQNKIDDAEIMVVGASQTIDSYKGYKDVTIAPFKVGKKIDIIGASQCEAELANKTRDYTDVLDRAIKLDSLYLASSEAGVANKYIKLDARHSKNITFTKREEGSGTDVSVAFTKEYTINTLTAVDFRSKDGNDASKGKFFGDSGVDDLNIVFNVVFNCTIDKGKDRITSSTGDLMIVDVYKNGKKLAYDDPDFKKAEGYLNKLSVVGFYIEATLTNSNFKDKGIQGFVKSETYATTIGNKTSIGLTGEIQPKEGNQSDYDLFTIEAQATYVEQQMSGDAVTKLLDYVQILKEAADINALDTFKADNLSEHFVVPYYQEVDVDLTKVVDSVKSSERLEDIRAALLNMIRYYVNIMDIKSSYRNAVQEVFKSPKRCVAAMVNSELAMLLNGDCGAGNISNRIPLTPDVDLIVAQSLYENEFQDKIILSYVTPDFNTAEGTPFLNVAHTLYAPMQNYTLDFMIRNSGSVKELHNILRYEHIFNLPIFTVFNVSGVSKTLQKCIHFTQVK